KHYVCNDSETDRYTLSVKVDERTLREVYLAPFEELVVGAGAWLVMAAYNGVNGVTMTENELLAEPLKGEWGFDGGVVSDWTTTWPPSSAKPPARAWCWSATRAACCHSRPPISSGSRSSGPTPRRPASRAAAAPAWSRATRCLPWPASRPPWAREWRCSTPPG